MKITNEIIDNLIEAANDARSKAYAPYSKFQVGAALLTDDDEIISGCNVENCSYGLTMCAERNAVATAIVQGKMDFKAMVIVADMNRPIMPCGACRQVLAEFNPSMLIVCVGTGGKRLELTVSDLLPASFTPADLNDKTLNLD